MKPDERQLEIRAMVERDGEVSVLALVDQYRVSGETIRRDLARLAAIGAVQKIHGGARRPFTHVENSFEERMFEQAAEKAIIGEKLSKIIAPGTCCFIDTGTTTLACAEALLEVPDITVITNSARIARVLGRRKGNGQIFLLGGRYAPDNIETVGPMAIAQIGMFHADYAILGVAAMDDNFGALDADADEAAIARAMCARSEKIIIVASSDKFARRASHQVCDLHNINTLISDVDPPDRLYRALTDANVTIV